VRVFIISLLLAIFITSCFSYPKTNRRHHFVKTEYPKNEFIIVRDAIICANIDGFRIKPLEINRDSVLSIFVNAFQKLPAKFEIRKGKAYCNRAFIARSKVKYRKFTFSEISPLLGEETNPILIPIINYNYIPRRNMYITSTGAVGGGGFQKNVHIELAIMIFRNNKLEYFSSRLFFTASETVYDYNESIDFSIKQENIDTLVQLTMKDYLERMK